MGLSARAGSRIEVRARHRATETGQPQSPNSCTHRTSLRVRFRVDARSGTTLRFTARRPDEAFSPSEPRMAHHMAHDRSRSEMTDTTCISRAELHEREDKFSVHNERGPYARSVKMIKRSVPAYALPAATSRPDRR
jgi:hypothetical protein